MSKYLETANELTNGLNSLFKNLTLWKFFKWIVTIFLIAVIALFINENFFSSSFYYDKIDWKIEVIEKIQNLSDNDSIIQHEINQKLLETLKGVDIPDANYLNIKELNFKFSKNFWEYLIKILGALLLPFLIIFSVRNDTDKNDTVVGATMFIIIFGIISFLIPTIYSVWINFFLMPIIQVLILLPFIIKNKKWDCHQKINNYLRLGIPHPLRPK